MDEFRFRTFVFFSKIKTRWNFWILLLKPIHQKGLLERIKKKLNFCFCRRILENNWQPLLKCNLLFANNSMVTDHFTFKKQKHVLVLVLNFTICVLILLQYLMWNKVNIVHPISMSLSSSWSESKRYNDGCALSKSEPVHSKGFVPCLLRTCNCDRSNNRALPQGCRSLGQWIMSSTGRFNMQLERVFFITSVGSSAQESRIHSKMVLFGDNFKFSAAVSSWIPTVPSQSFLFSASGLERLVPRNVRCLDILGGPFWHYYLIDFFSDCNT